MRATLSWFWMDCGLPAADGQCLPGWWAQRLPLTRCLPAALTPPCSAVRAPHELGWASGAAGPRVTLSMARLAQAASQLQLGRGFTGWYLLLPGACRSEGFCCLSV